MKPMCAVCKMPVEEFYIEQRADCFMNAYIAVCHGETDRMELGGEDLFLLRSGSDRIVEFVAFREKPKLAHEAPSLHAAHRALPE